MHPSTYDYIQPTANQIKDMNILRKKAAEYATWLDMLPDGPDKTYAIRKFREVAMWVNICITRHSDGTPRAEITPLYPPDHPAPGDLGSVPL